MVMQNIWAWVFGRPDDADDAYVQSAAEIKLIDYLVSLINRQDLIADELREREKITGVADAGKRQLAYAKLYFRLEKFLLANKPLVTKREFAGKQELRADVRQRGLVDGLSAPVKLIFAEETEQAAELYTYAFSEIVAYTRHNLGEAEVTSILAAATQGTLLHGAELQGNSLAIDTVTSAIGVAPLSEVTVAFKKVYRGFLERIAAILGEKAAVLAAKRAYDALVEHFDQGLVSLFLNVVPEGFLESEKLFALSREELEKRVLEATAALQKEKERVEHEVEERTRELKKAVEDLYASNQLLSQREQELSKANVELRELDKRKSEFLSIAAHQLRTPLSGFKWALDMLIKGEVGPVAIEQKVLLMKSYETNERLIRLVNEMLHATKIDSGMLLLRKSSTQLLDLLDSVLYEILPSASKAQVSIRFEERDDTLPPLMVDPEKMRAVFQNLLENAVKYSRPGGEVGIFASRTRDTVQFAIKDHGIGIPISEQAHIFTRFFRAENARKVDPNGTGLGLYIVKNVIEMHGGTIRLESREGEGTTIYFTLNV